MKDSKAESKGLVKVNRLGFRLGFACLPLGFMQDVAMKLKLSDLVGEVEVENNAYVHVLCKFRAGDALSVRIFVTKLFETMPNDNISSVLFWFTPRTAPLGVVEVSVKAFHASTVAALGKICGAYNFTYSVNHR